MTHIAEGAFYLLVAHDPISMKQRTRQNMNKKEFQEEIVTTDSNSALRFSQ